MKTGTKNIITRATCVMLIYVSVIHLPVSLVVVFLIFLASVASLLWMVYAILKDTTNLSGKKFEDQFYEND